MWLNMCYNITLGSTEIGYPMRTDPSKSRVVVTCHLIITFLFNYQSTQTLPSPWLAGSTVQFTAGIAISSVRMATTRISNVRVRLTTRANCCLFRERSTSSGCIVGKIDEAINSVTVMRVTVVSWQSSTVCLIKWKDMYNQLIIKKKLIVKSNESYKYIYSCIKETSTLQYLIAVTWYMSQISQSSSIK